MQWQRMCHLRFEVIVHDVEMVFDVHSKKLSGLSMVDCKVADDV